MEKRAWLRKKRGVIDRQNWVHRRQAAVKLRLRGLHEKQEHKTKKRVTEKEQFCPRLAPLGLIKPSYPKTRKKLTEHLQTYNKHSHHNGWFPCLARGFSRMKKNQTTLAQAKCAVEGTALQLVVKELRFHCSYKRRSANRPAQEKPLKQD
jgi:hypothetical protein